MLHELIPQFATARGTVNEWYDKVTSKAAHAHWKRIWYEHRVAGEARAKAENPGLVAKSRRMKEEYLAQHPEVIPVEPSADVPDIWEPEPLVRHVAVRWPEESLTETFRSGTGGSQRIGTMVVNATHTFGEALITPPPNAFRESHPYQPHRRDDLDAYCYGPHPREALALLQPNCFQHGWAADWGGRVATTALGRPADLVSLRRLIPLSDPRMLGDALNPTVFRESEHAAVIIDRERQVILEWRGLWEGEPYERHFFTAIEFDVPIDEGMFSPEAWPEA